jgi:hypothetical protein
MQWYKHLIYIGIIILLQLINFHAVGYTQHKSDCVMFYKQWVYNERHLLKDKLVTGIQG